MQAFLLLNSNVFLLREKPCTLRKSFDEAALRIFFSAAESGKLFKRLEPVKKLYFKTAEEKKSAAKDKKKKINTESEK